MILFIIITSFIISITKTEETNKSKLTLYNTEIENLKGYQQASKQITSQSFRNLIQFECKNENVDCSGHGRCNEEKTECICELGFTTFPEDSTVQCFGAGHFYCERYLNASLKLVAFLFGVLIICLLPLSAKFINDKCENDCLVLTTSCFYYICAMGLAFWFIYDLIIFGKNKYLDGNGVPLANWGT